MEAQFLISVPSSFQSRPPSPCWKNGGAEHCGFFHCSLNALHLRRGLLHSKVFLSFLPFSSSSSSSTSPSRSWQEVLLLDLANQAESTHPPRWPPCLQFDRWSLRAGASSALLSCLVDVVSAVVLVGVVVVVVLPC